MHLTRHYPVRIFNTACKAIKKIGFKIGTGIILATKKETVFKKIIRAVTCFLRQS